MEVAKKVCQEMLEQRKWQIHNADDLEITGVTNANKKYIVTFIDSPKLNIANVKDCIKMLETEKTPHCIVVYNNNITSSAKKVINNYVDAIFELFTLQDLQFNITTHYLVPYHYMLNKTETDDFKQKMGTDIPVLQKTDKVCRFYNFPRGAIIQVTRRDGGIGYRIVK